MRSTRRSPFVPAVLATLLLLGASLVVRESSDEVREEALGAVEDDTRSTSPVAPVALDELTGLWARWDAPKDGERTRFWYFHGDGHGLYRYGRVGLVNTHSFDYTLDEEVPGVVRFTYRKTGRAHVLEAVLGTREDGRRTLRLVGDPEDPGAEYVLVAGRVEGEPAPVAAAREGHGIGDRLWIDWQAHAAGGGSFRMYQLAATAIDGRGVGWFHEGDFDDWSTEAFDYRVVSTARPTATADSGTSTEIIGELHMQFRLRGEAASTSFVLREAPKSASTGNTTTAADPAPRTLELLDDPRDFWSSHRYLDGGPSFSASRAFEVMTALASREERATSGH
jgi:hypothetical protein